MKAPWLRAAKVACAKLLANVLSEWMWKVAMVRGRRGRYSVSKLDAGSGSPPRGQHLGVVGSALVHPPLVVVRQEEDVPGRCRNGRA